LSASGRRVGFFAWGDVRAASKRRFLGVFTNSRFIFAGWIGMVNNLTAPEHVVVSGRALTGGNAARAVIAARA
jgi:hypothetical protein